MTPEDARHGTRAGYYAHRRDNETACEPCKRAASREFNQRILNNTRGIPTSYPAHTVRRRIQALIANGWHNGAIAARLGVTVNMVQSWESDDYGHVRVSTYRKVAAVYDELSMTLAPDSYGSRRARARAVRRGYAPPLAYDDIDTDPAPHAGIDQYGPSHAHVDEVRVLRILSGDMTLAREATNAERHQIVARWQGPLAELEKRAGWKPERYIDREDGAA